MPHLLVGESQNNFQINLSSIQFSFCVEETRTAKRGEVHAPAKTLDRDTAYIGPFPIPTQYDRVLGSGLLWKTLGMKGKTVPVLMSSHTRP
jgi:hypothetical protein